VGGRREWEIESPEGKESEGDPLSSGKVSSVTFGWTDYVYALQFTKKRKHTGEGGAILIDDRLQLITTNPAPPPLPTPNPWGKVK